MERPDLSLIHDADLLKQVEEARGKGFFDTTARAIIAVQQRRDNDKAEQAGKIAQLAAMPREKRRRAQIREVFENEAPSQSDIRHLHSVLAICGLPYDKLPEGSRDFERRQGSMALDITAGYLRGPNGEKVLQPIPYGPKARLVLMHLCSEAVRQKSPTIELADTFTAFVRDMGFSDSGGQRGPLTAFKQQLNALAACTMKVSVWDGEHSRTRSISPIEDFDLWLSNNPAQRSLWPSTVTFSQNMFDSLSRHALPVNVRAVSAFAGSARKLDLYFWFGYRLHNLKHPLHISWNALAEQFGTGFTRQRDFKAQIARELADLMEVFPKLPAAFTEDGLTLRPAGPDVLALPIPKSLLKRRS